MVEDDQQNLWVGSTAGIVRLSRSRNEIRLFNKNQGVDGSTLSLYEMKATKSRSGKLFFANMTGYYYFFPDQIKSNSHPPQIVISDFWLADQLVKAGMDGPLKQPVTQTKEISLNHTQHTFSFDFAGIHFSSPEDNQLFFMLENLENTWKKAGQEKKAWYYNVPPGNYIFRVKAASKDGVWAEKAIAIIISPPWYREWWAFVLYVIAFITFVWIFTWYRSRMLKAENLLLEEKVNKRTHELEESLQEKFELSKKVESQQALLNERLRISRELHDDIGSTLGSISIYSEVAKKRTEKNENTNEVLAKIGLASRELIDKMGDIVWSLNPGNEGFEQLQNRMLAFAAMILAPRNILYHFCVDEALKKMKFTGEQRKNTFLIFKEALHNIVKYAQCKTVEIAISLRDNNVIMIIKDDGQGFDMAQALPGKMNTQGEFMGGNGIKNMYSRAADLNGRLCIDSKINSGTTIHLEFPL
jgi:signal transduction histidine kinase